MHSISLKAKFGLLLGLVITASIVTLVFVNLRLNNFDAQFSDFHKAGVELDRHTLMVSRDTNYISRLTRSIMLGDDLGKNLGALDKTIEQIQTSFTAMQNAANEIDDRTVQSNLSSLIRAAHDDTLAFANDARDRMSKLKGQEQTPELLNATWSDYRKAATPVANKARESFKSLTEAAQNYLESTRTSTGESLTSVKTVLTLVQVLSTAFVVAFGLYLLNSILAPLGKAAQIADRVAAGDLTTPINAHGTDETGRMLGALSKMQGQLHGVVSQIGSVSSTVQETAQGLASSVSTVSGHAEEQAQSTTEMAAAIEEMTVGINHMASNAAASTSGAEQSQQTANEGRHIVDQAAAELRAIVSSVTQASALVETLNQRSDEISKIVSVIKDIADQTNLLALNAAIEAARAGEQGRGFAVVADEVRKLAERTTQSTAAISEMLNSVQQATHQVVKQMADSTVLVESGAQKAESSRSYMQRIGEGAHDMVNVIGDISAGLREQGQASDLVAHNVEKITRMTEQTSSELARVSQAAKELDKMAVELKEAVAIFRV
jgi:methyl-accepting chemotaxis protein